MNPDTMNQDALDNLYWSLRKGDMISLTFSSCMSRKLTLTLTVTSPHRTVGKRKVNRVILKQDTLGLKFTLFNDDNRTSLAVGDMGALIHDATLVHPA
tara:strand:- start:3451 stop:3744 length:294 start_codon:yes stop_codon:yes gene_type:complete